MQNISDYSTTAYSRGKQKSSHRIFEAVLLLHIVVVKRIKQPPIQTVPNICVGVHPTFAVQRVLVGPPWAHLTRLCNPLPDLNYLVGEGPSFHDDPIPVIVLHIVRRGGVLGLGLHGEGDISSGGQGGVGLVFIQCLL